MPRVLFFGWILLLAGCASSRLPEVNADWSTNATAHRGENGQRFLYTCPPNPSRTNLGTVWGSEVYSDDSAVCVAAVHAGALTLAAGGRVVIEIRAGETSYRGTTWNGVATRDWGDWHGSFVIVRAL